MAIPARSPFGERRTFGGGAAVPAGTGSAGMSEEPRGAGRGGRRARVLAMALGQGLVWAGMFYSFPALLPHWERGLGWSKASLSGAFTLALLLSAVAAPAAGRLIDRGHGVTLLGSSALLGALLLLALSQAEAVWHFYLIWMGLGVVMAGALYEPCFAHLTHVLGAEARRAITTVTLIAGFAGTVSFPTSHLLAEAFGWRGAMVGLAVLVGAAGCPLMWWGARLPAGTRTDAGGESAPAPGEAGTLGGALRSPVFWLLSIAFATTALNHGMVISHFLPLVGERGVIGGAAVLAAALVGPMQIAGRLAMVAVQDRLSMAAITTISFAFVALASTTLFFVALLPPLVFVFVALQGSGYGVTSITKPVITLEFLGRRGFGVISGAVATAYMGAFALGPMTAALLHGFGGYDLVVVACAAMALAGIACFAGASRLHTRRDSRV